MKTPTIIAAGIAVGVLLLSTAGCSYSFSGSSVPSHLKSVAIPLFEDQSGFGEAGLREHLTQKLTELFINDNSLAIADRATADAIVEGNIIAISDAPSVISPGEQVSKRRITMTIHVVFQDMKLRKKVWERDFSNYGDYTMGAETRTVALDLASTRITEDILIETVSGW